LLEEADLVVSEKRSRVRHCRLGPRRLAPDVVEVIGERQIRLRHAPRL
jgi:hypothetical protein